MAEVKKDQKKPEKREAETPIQKLEKQRDVIIKRISENSIQVDKDKKELGKINSRLSKYNNKNAPSFNEIRKVGIDLYNKIKQEDYVVVKNKR